jgi:CBS domain-containing protein
MLLKEICTTGVAFCGRSTSVLDAAALMRTRHTGDLVIVDDISDGSAPSGVITDRDIVVKVLGNNLDPRTVTVGDVMRTPIVLGRDTEDLSEAVARMRTHGVRRLPIVDSRGKLVGIVTLDDLLKGLAGEATALMDIVAKEQDQERRRTL